MCQVRPRKKRVLMTVSMENDIYVIEQAHRMGFEVIIANFYTEEQAPVKKMADESYIIDASDIDAMVRFVKEKDIDGIFVTASDAHVHFYCDICAATGLNAYCTQEQARAISNKLQFKKNCRKYGLNVTPEYEISEVSDLDALDITYPIMVKSPDNSGGSLGMTLVYSPERLPEAIEYAKEYSPSRSVVVERFFDGDEFVINYMFVNGTPHVVYTKDYCKNIVDGQVQRDNAMISPSKYEKLFYEKADAKLRAMFHGIGMQNGIIFLQCFVENDELYFFEGGCRAGGSDEYLLWNKIYGFDFIGAMLSFALTHDYGVPDIEERLENTVQTKKYSVLNLIASGGTVKEYHGIETVRQRPGVLALTVMKAPGATIREGMTAQQILIRVMIEAKDAEEYLSIVDEIYSTIHIESEDGREMLIPCIDLSHWL